MAKGLRVMLAPMPASGGSPGEAPRILGATVSLERRGGGRTQANRKESVAATLTFSVRFFDAIRGDGGTEPEELGSIDGNVMLAEDTGEPSFLASPPTEDEPGPLEPSEPLEDPDEPQRSSPPRRVLRLAFDGEQFPDVGELGLVLPAEAEDHHFVEILTELTVAGATEASIEQNDVLDIPLRHDAPGLLPAFAPQIVDEIGEPLAELDVEFELDGATKPKQTDDKGVARLFDAGAAIAKLSLPEPAELKALLKPRWDEIRGTNRVVPADGVQCVALGTDVETTFMVQAGVPLVVSLQPRVERARFLNLFFDSSKTFILPDADAVTQTLSAIYARNTPSKLLIVGHTDTSGDDAYNDKLSLERAETVLAYLKDDVDGWLEWYGDDVPSEKRWGANEDLAMLNALPDRGGAPDPGESPVTAFQRTRGLTVDGKAGPETRRQLVTEYMALDGATLPPDIEPTLHGCGEHFPDSGSPNDTRDPDDRRVELFFFDDDLGIQPAPPGRISAAGSKEYPEWLRRAALTELDNAQLRPVVIRLLDPLNQPLAGAPYELSVGDDVRSGHSDEHGVLLEDAVEVPNRCTLRWGYPPADDAEPEAGDDAGGSNLVFRRVIFLDYAVPDQANQREAARRRLSNLGYVDRSFANNISQFQLDFGLPQRPFFDQATFDKLREVHDGV